MQHFAYKLFDLDKLFMMLQVVNTGNKSYEYMCVEAATAPLAQICDPHPYVSQMMQQLPVWMPR